MKLYYEDTHTKLYCCDVMDGLRAMPDESIHCCITSPPYYALRDYGTAKWEGGSDPECDHAVRDDPHVESSTLAGGKESTGHQREGYHTVCGKCGARRIDKQLGLEDSPEAYLARMVEVFREVRRVLRRDGTCWVNMGDGYNSGMSSSAMWEPNAGAYNDVYVHKRAKNLTADKKQIDPSLKPKDLMMMPFRLVLELQRDGWWVRSVIPWLKGSVMPESVTDRPTTATEYMILLVKSERYYYDAEAVRVRQKASSRERARYGWNGCTDDNSNGARTGGSFKKMAESGEKIRTIPKDGGRNRRNSDSFFESWQGLWEEDDEPLALVVNPEATSFAHFATFPRGLVRPCILAGTSERGVCMECGAPWSRVVEKPKPPMEVFTNRNAPTDGMIHSGYSVNGEMKGSRQKLQNWLNEHPAQTLFWEPTCSCQCEEVVPATVLDPFAGSGTTLEVAKSLGRRSVGLELSKDYCALAVKHRLKGQQMLEL